MQQFVEETAFLLAGYVEDETLKGKIEREPGNPSAWWGEVSCAASRGTLPQDAQTLLKLIAETEELAAVRDTLAGNLSLENIELVRSTNQGRFGGSFFAAVKPNLIARVQALASNENLELLAKTSSPKEVAAELITYLDVLYENGNWEESPLVDRAWEQLDTFAQQHNFHVFRIRHLGAAETEDLKKFFAGFGGSFLYSLEMDESMTLVATHKNEIAGFALAIPKGAAYLIAAEPEAKNAGVTERFINRCASLLYSNGIPKSTLYTYDRDRKGHHWTGQPRTIIEF